MRRTFRRRALLLLALALLVVVFYNKGNLLGRFMYPIYYQDEIKSNSAQFGIDPLLVAAIIYVESKYKPELVSNKGAIGLMQIMPNTANWIFGMDGYRKYTIQSLKDPHTNIAVGVKYLDLLNSQFNHNIAEVLAAYNAGPSNVIKWRQTNIWDGKIETINRIGFWETRNYVDKVIRYYKIYQKTYA